MKDALTYRHPRTLDEAFGCDADSACPFHPDERLPCRADRPVVITCALIVLVLLHGAYTGWL